MGPVRVVSHAGPGTAIVLAHMAVVLLHGEAHARLAVELGSWQTVFAATVIVLAPLVAAVLLWTRYWCSGALLLAASMAGSLVFGVYHHFVAVSPDHVSHLPPGEARELFRVTAWLLPISEAAGLVVGAWSVRSRRPIRFLV